MLKVCIHLSELGDIEISAAEVLIPFVIGGRNCCGDLEKKFISLQGK